MKDEIGLRQELGEASQKLGRPKAQGVARIGRLESSLGPWSLGASDPIRKVWACVFPTAFSGPGPQFPPTISPRVRVSG